MSNMLKYLISTLEYLIVMGVLLGMLYAYLYGRCGVRGRKILTGFSLAGLAAATLLAYLKNKTKLIDTGNMNILLFSISISALILFLVLDLQKLFTKWNTGADQDAAEDERFTRKAVLLVSIPASIVAFIEVTYSLPDVLAYPYTIVLNGDNVFSTGFLYRFIGIVLGAVLVLVCSLSAHFVCRRISVRATGVLLKIALLITGFQQFTKILQTLLTRRYISGKAIFRLIKFTSNHARLFIFGVLLTVIFLPIVLWIRSFHVNEPYTNPAEHRKIKAKWRSIRRWSTSLIASTLLVILCITAVKSYVNRPVQLSAAEECEIRGDNLYIPFTQVEDGHLHRFAYTTDSGVAVRFIVIKKPNSTAYGVGLDACDICGETGYYERDGQVVCNRCDVVMNVNTIGFKGGCNPKVIDYSIENGYIIVPTYTLIEHEKDFS